MGTTNRFRYGPDVAWQLVGGRVVIVDLAKGAALGLNETASAIWPLLESAGFEEIVNAVRGRFDVEPDEARAGVAGLVDDLVSRGLVVEAP